MVILKKKKLWIFSKSIDPKDPKPSKMTTLPKSEKKLNNDDENSKEEIVVEEDLKKKLKNKKVHPSPLVP
jgi:hypothetical protein